MIQTTQVTASITRGGRRRGCGYFYRDSRDFELNEPISSALSTALPILLQPFAPLEAPYAVPRFKRGALLVKAGTGAGKTRAVLETIVPFALKEAKQVCFVSSRAAIGVQFKKSLAKALEQEEMLNDYTPSGLRRLSQIGPVRVLTYHSLWSAICKGEEWLKKNDILVFDEIHALTLDATFVSFTGPLLQKIPVIFSGAARIYLTATPAPVMDSLLQAEGNWRLVVWCWPVDYRAFNLHFYQGPNDIVERLNALPNGEKALVFVPSILKGKTMMKDVAKSCALITAKTKEDEPEAWNRLLSTQTLEEQVTFATTTLDAGVSLTDPALKHIFCFGLNSAAVIQQAGRKRLKKNERLNVYVWSPTRGELSRYQYKNKEIQDILTLANSNPYKFNQTCILEDNFPFIRKMCYLESGSSIKPNPLALEYYLQEEDIIMGLLEKGSEYPADAHWCEVFGQELPTDKSHWLDHRFDETAKAELFAWLDERVDVPIKGKEAQKGFGVRFKQLYHAAFGSRKNDRSDRTWGLDIIRKVLEELGGAYWMESEKGSWCLVKIKCESALLGADIIDGKKGE